VSAAEGPAADDIAGTYDYRDTQGVLTLLGTNLYGWRDPNNVWPSLERDLAANTIRPKEGTPGCAFAIERDASGNTAVSLLCAGQYRWTRIAAAPRTTWTEALLRACATNDVEAVKAIVAKGKGSGEHFELPGGGSFAAALGYPYAPRRYALHAARRRAMLPCECYAYAGFAGVGAWHYALRFGDAQLVKELLTCGKPIPWATRDALGLGLDHYLGSAFDATGEKLALLKARRVVPGAWAPTKEADDAAARWPKPTWTLATLPKAGAPCAAAYQAVEDAFFAWCVEHRVPGGAVAIVSATGEVLLNRACGAAVLVPESSADAIVPMTPEHGVLYGSIGKTLHTIGLLALLEDNGALPNALNRSLYDTFGPELVAVATRAIAAAGETGSAPSSASKEAPSAAAAGAAGAAAASASAPPPSAPEHLDQITLGMLLRHTSGLGTTTLNGSAVRRALEATMLATPGEEYKYSNAAYSLLHAAFERILEETFTDPAEPKVRRVLPVVATRFVDIRNDPSVQVIVRGTRVPYSRDHPPPPSVDPLPPPRSQRRVQCYIESRVLARCGAAQTWAFGDSRFQPWDGVGGSAAHAYTERGGEWANLALSAGGNGAPWVGLGTRARGFPMGGWPMGASGYGGTALSLARALQSFGGDAKRGGSSVLRKATIDLAMTIVAPSKCGLNIIPYGETKSGAVWGHGGSNGAVAALMPNGEAVVAVVNGTLATARATIHADEPEELYKSIGFYERMRAPLYELF
jgi:CubicO group peptidase (beta-lactamase class C family)